MDELTREEGREWPATSHGTLPTFTLINILPVFLFTFVFKKMCPKYVSGEKALIWDRNL